jgi:hypothetical protein
MKGQFSTVVAVLALGIASLGAFGQPQQPPPPQAPQAQGQGQRQGRGGNQQARDRAQVVPQGTAAIAGRVLTADTGRPVKRARVTVAGGGRGGRSATTDDQGRYQIGELAAGNYGVTASKTGFVDAVYGQRRPLQPGTPITLADAQAVTNIDLRLTRGGVITGHVGDEDGEPLARALVTVQRYQYVRGEKQLTPAGGDQTDDRGQYRVFGLPPGEYYVSASATGLGELIGRGLQQLAAGLAAGGGRGGRGGAGGLPPGFGAPEPPESTGYAPTYYPGVVSAGEAGKVSLAPGQEASGIDFQIQLVPLATVTGLVSGAQDTANVLLVPQDSGGGLGRFGGQTLVGRPMPDGTFSIANVPPGRYVVVARSGGRSGDPRTAMQPIVVNGQNLDGVALVLQPGVSVSGNITVESSGTPAPADYSVFLVDVPDVDPLPGGLGGGAGGRGGRGGPFGSANRVDKNGSFTVGNLQPGRHFVRVAGGGAQGGGQWTLKSVTLGGVDVADQPFELKPGQNVDGVNVVLTDRASELAGTVRDAKNAATGGVTVIAFSTEAQYWRAQSRRISTSRTGQTGAYRIRGLPAGDYYVVAVEDVEQGEWFDPAYLDSMKDKATHVTLSDGDKKTLDLRGSS